MGTSGNSPIPAHVREAAACKGRDKPGFVLMDVVTPIWGTQVEMLSAKSTTLHGG